MPNSSKIFSSYIPCLGNQKIKIVDGTIVNVVGQGDVFLTSLTLRNALHVPKLSVNLLSIPQITKGPKLLGEVYSIWVFFSFPDLLIGKVIGHAREEGKLYLLEAKSGMTCPTPHTYLLGHPTLTKEQVWLFHFRLGYPLFFFLLLKRIFLHMFEKLMIKTSSVSMLNITMCLFLWGKRKVLFHLVWSI